MTDEKPVIDVDPKWREDLVRKKTISEVARTYRAKARGGNATRAYMLDPTDHFLRLAKEWDEVDKSDEDTVDLFVKNLLDEYHASMVQGKRASAEAGNARAELQVIEAQRELHPEEENLPWWKKLLVSLR
jgi:hypothetical protein